MDLTAFETFLLTDLAWKPITVKTTLRRIRYAQRRGLTLEPYQVDLVKNYLAARRRANATTYAYNGDVKLLNAYHRYKHGTDKGPYRLLKDPPSTPKSLTEAEVQRVLAYRNPSNHQTEAFRRALALFALKTGMRSSEVHALETRDLDPDNSRVFVRKPAKNGLQRWIPVERWLWSPKRAFGAWLQTRPIPPMDPQAVWTTSIKGGDNGSGQTTPHRVSPKFLHLALGRTGQSVGVRLNFNVTRHTRASELVRHGWDILYVQFYLGHKSVRSTEIYARLRAEDVQWMMGKKPPKDPYQENPK